MKTPAPETLALPDDMGTCMCTVCQMTRRARVWTHYAFSLNDSKLETEALDVASRYTTMALMINQLTDVRALNDYEQPGSPARRHH